jgi:hypothetical protein
MSIVVPFKKNQKVSIDLLGGDECFYFFKKSLAELPRELPLLSSL